MDETQGGNEGDETQRGNEGGWQWMKHKGMKGARGGKDETQGDE